LALPSKLNIQKVLGVNDRGMTPLHMVCKYDEVSCDEIVKELLIYVEEVGADINEFIKCVQEDGHNALHLAVKDGHCSISETLLSYVKHKSNDFLKEFILLPE